jgi:hypothetical protein
LLHWFSYSIFENCALWDDNLLLTFSREKSDCITQHLLVRQTKAVKSVNVVTKRTWSISKLFKCGWKTTFEYSRDKEQSPRNRGRFVTKKIVSMVVAVRYQVLRKGITKFSTTETALKRLKRAAFILS